MDKIEKYLRRLSTEDRQTILVLLTRLSKGNTSNLTIKKLTGYADIYRVRVGKSRIIFQQTSTGINLIDIAKRDEKTYKNFNRSFDIAAPNIES